MEKKMENKYYTPSIEELHVGFECEMHDEKEEIAEFGEARDRSILFGEPISLDLPSHWKTITMTKEVYSSHIYNPTNPLFEIRVKYLDIEDIESLGFLKSGLSDDVFIYKDKIDIRGDGNKATIGINFTGNYITLIFFVPGEKIFLPPGVNLFRGIIKNKSELKVLLKQLGIDV